MGLKIMSFISFAESELDRIGMTADSDDEMNVSMREHILRMVEAFADEGHSGFSANYAVNCLDKLLRYEPLSPLTGEDDEWNEVGDGVYQNKRCSRVFKENDEAYDIDGIVFWEWYTDPETGEKFKSHFTCKDSRVPVEFPYVPKTEYKERIV
jgi:hypothetical protein